MLNSYQAEINSSQLIWIDQPHKPVEHRRVLVMMEDATPMLSKGTPDDAAYDAFMRAATAALTTGHRTTLRKL